MIKNIAFVICLITSCVYSQEVIYFNKSWKETVKDSAAFYRKCQKSENGYDCTFYTIKGKKHSEGGYRSLAPIVIDGDFKYYNNKQQITSISHYRNNALNGYELKFDKKGKLLSKRKYVDGFLEDTLFSYYPDGILKRYEFYKKGKFVSGKVFKKNGQDTTFYPLEEPGGFVGGNKAMAEFIQKNLVYPQVAREKNIQGKVFLKFYIDKKGRVKKIKVEKKVHPLLDKAAKDVLKKMPLWKVARFDGLPFRCYYTLPISFKLTD